MNINVLVSKTKFPVGEKDIVTPSQHFTAYDISRTILHLFSVSLSKS